MTKEEGLKRILDGNFRNEHGFDLQIMVDCMGLVKEILLNLEKEYIPLSVLEDIKAEIQEHTQRYTLARESGGMGQVDWSDYLIKADDVLTIIDNHIKAGDKE